jgi:YARHG domain
MFDNRSLPRAARAGTAALALLLAAQIATPAAAQSYRRMSCSELWYERNSIYAEKGYCFETARARNAFPDSCFAPWGRLSRAERRQVEDIQYWERRKGC